MPRTPEQVLKEIVSNQIFMIAQLTAENEKLVEESQKIKDDISKLENNIQKLIGEIAILSERKHD